MSDETAQPDRRFTVGGLKVSGIRECDVNGVVASALLRLDLALFISSSSLVCG